MVNELVDALESTDDGAFIVNDQLKIVFANHAAQKFMGHNLDSNGRRYCFQILRGRNEKGRLVCTKNCRVANLLFAGASVSNFDLHSRTPSKPERWLNMSAFRYDQEDKDQSYIVHLFRDITQRKKDETFVERLIEAARHYHNLEPDPVAENKPTQLYEQLTPREREVLQLLAKGYSTRQIAEQLSISANTTRNHIQHLLQKLNVHSRLEAVITGIKWDLVDDKD